MRANSRTYLGISGRVVGFTKNCLVYDDGGGDQKILPLRHIVMEVEGLRVDGRTLLRLLQEL
ncbi:hypothetical protein [Methanopyrus kandleri]|uniref:Uncharacterized protein n=1 Tax=Methanopyrus kandleri TaxID=2320 RepID=A0A832T9G0_9EURY|nr:hypothetical protein [Methanopyrus kandleri]